MLGLLVMVPGGSYARGSDRSNPAEGKDSMEQGSDSKVVAMHS